MNDKQTRLNTYFSTLTLPQPPTREDITESLTEVMTLPAAPPQVSPEAVGNLLTQRREAQQTQREAGESVEESLLESAPVGLRESGLPLPSRQPMEHAITDHIINVGVKAVEKALADQEMSTEQGEIFEAIILPGLRPVIDIVGGDMTALPAGWEFLGDYRSVIKKVLPAIGRIDLTDMPQLPYAGTGFFVGSEVGKGGAKTGLLLTNRHVAKIFVEGVGAGSRYLRFRPGISARLAPKYEVGDPDTDALEYEVIEALVVHPYWDAALLRVRATEGSELPAPLSLARQSPPNFGGGAQPHILVVGYPWFDSRNNAEQQINIFHNVFGRKRLMPGYLTGTRKGVRTEWKTQLDAVMHDATTLGGNSGSAILDLQTGTVLALHFGGRYLDANFGVPAWELARDPKIATGLLFDPGPSLSASVPAPVWLSNWDGVQPLAQQEGTAPVPNAHAATASGTAASTAPAASDAAASVSSASPAASSDRSAAPLSPQGNGVSPEVPLLPVAPDWFERTSDADLVEALRRDRTTTELLIRQTLLPAEADDLLQDLEQAAFVGTEENLFDTLRGSAKPDPTLPEIIYLHGIMGGHLRGRAGLGGRLWLSPLALAAGRVAQRLMLDSDGERDREESQTVTPDGHIRLSYEKAARKWRLDGFVVHEFSYDWRKSIANAADHLHFYLESLHLERTGKKFALVGHSMGGLVCALYAVRHPEWAGRVSQAIFLGSPLRGSFVPVEALLGTYPALPKLAFADTQNNLDDYTQMTRTLPGLIDMLPDPDIFPGAARLYERAAWPQANAPAQLWLDQSRQVKRLLAASPILETARLIVSPDHPTMNYVDFASETVRPGRRNGRGDGTVPTRSAAGSVPGVTVYRAETSHGELPREAGVIQAVALLLREGRCTLPLLTREEIENPTPLEEAITEAIEESVTADLQTRLRDGIFTQRDADFLLRADHATTPGPEHAIQTGGQS